MGEGETERLLSNEEAPDIENQEPEKETESVVRSSDAVLVIPAASPLSSAAARPAVVTAPSSKCSASGADPLLDDQSSARTSKSGSECGETSGSSKDERSLCRICLVSLEVLIVPQPLSGAHILLSLLPLLASFQSKPH